MRRFELTAPIRGNLEEAWAALTDLSTWPEWNRLVPYARGDMREGSILELHIHGPGGRRQVFRPKVDLVSPPQELVMSAAVIHPRLVHMVHTFELETIRPDAILLRQSWVATGLLVPVLWTLLQRGMLRFQSVGVDLSLRAVTK